MKVSQLLEDDREPILLPILRNAIRSGKEVRVYHMGTGGTISHIEWDPPDSDLGTVLGVSAFKTSDGDWVTVSDKNLEKMKIKKHVSNGVEVLTLSKPSAQPREWVDESEASAPLEVIQEKAKGTPPEWAAKEQAELRSLAQGFGFQLLTLKPEKSDTMKGTTDMYIGGQLKDKYKNSETDLPLDLRLVGLRKSLAAHLLKKAKEDRYVKIFTRQWWRHDLRYIFPEDTKRAAEAAVSAVVTFSYDRDDFHRTKPLLYVWYSLSEPKHENP